MVFKEDGFTWYKGNKSMNVHYTATTATLHYRYITTTLHYHYITVPVHYHYHYTTFHYSTSKSYKQNLYRELIYSTWNHRGFQDDTTMNLQVASSYN